MVRNPGLGIGHWALGIFPYSSLTSHSWELIIQWANAVISWFSTSG
ncbi:MAG: hypothetical protein V7L23_03310 [Nostoc sp.]